MIVKQWKTNSLSRSNTKSKLHKYLSSPVKEKWSNEKVPLSISSATIPYSTERAFHVCTCVFYFESLVSYHPAPINARARWGSWCFIGAPSIFIRPWNRNILSKKKKKIPWNRNKKWARKTAKPWYSIFFCNEQSTCHIVDILLHM